MNPFNQPTHNCCPPPIPHHHHHHCDYDEIDDNEIIDLDVTFSEDYVLDTEVEGDKIDIDSDFIDLIISGGGGGKEITYTNPRVEQNVGNVKIGESFDHETIQKVFDRIFAPSYVKPSISIGLSCKSLYDKDTESLTSVTITANVTPKSEKISYIKFYANNTLLETITSGVADGGIFKYTYTPADPIKSTTSFKVETCDVKTQTVVSSTAYVTFVQKSYWGGISSVLSPTDVEVITLLNHDLKTNIKLVTPFTVEYGRFVYAHPKAIGSVTSIKDEVNSFNYTDSCTKATVTIDGGEYEVVYLTECAGFEDVPITFA